MPDAATTPSLWTILLAVVTGGTAIGFLNAYLNRGTPRHTQLLLGAQTERERAEAGRAKAEADLSVARGAFELLDRVEAESRRKDARIAELEAKLRQQDEILDEMRRIDDGRGPIIRPGNGRGS